MSGILIATLLATVSAKIPAGLSGGDVLYSDCSGSRQFVVGYVAGWLDKWNSDEYLARRIFTEAAPTPSRMVNSAHFAIAVGVNVCIPTGATAEAIGNALCTFLEENPGIREATGDELMMTLAHYKYHCPIP
ncbi:Rap1a/Tai family immunity protein [Rhizobium redzepovicii]|uniref:Rap1a/Tai family immunity protein n=1 Tax=Rhizobium redzepovicii TaxID=2867518 RepID=A0AAW8P3B5_9HYPH|nr:MULTISPECIES: Rap1a/Tai family immunity protein [Rhizobium]MBB3524774.1 hypothetical protein [Rhizobium sp. BK456]MBY4589099.1 hypothetical protein [Rhizobium redzepovicii]MBY4616648.1 hypothetical protein [Rhizobium redzepovicii]MDF0659775.1 Rap1a/Tai family immunity protein [Rhizobium sp. BC49]MDR9760851.1 Rap1a/Tai family immunity protein [Rhizobium redzepovicii]